MMRQNQIQHSGRLLSLSMINLHGEIETLAQDLKSDDELESTSVSR